MTQALLLMDVQNGIIDRIGADGSYLDRVAAAQQRAEQAGLVLGGISTSGVVLSTVREAADRDYQITVLEDPCLDGDQEVHRVLTGKVFPRQAEVTSAVSWQP